MTSQNVRNLLTKYYAGETTLAEEDALREFFRRAEVPADLAPHQPLFRYFHDRRSQDAPPALEREVLDRLHQREAGGGKVRRLYPILIRAAAVALLALATWWMWPRMEPSTATAAIDWSKYEPQTQEEAMKVTKKAFLRLSTELNRGTAKAAVELDKVERIGRFFE